MIKLVSDRLKVLIDPLGAQIRSVKAGRHEFMWQGKLPWWPRTAPVLFPIVGKLRDDRYLHHGRSYTLGQHGFARDMPFSVMEKTSESVVLLLESTGETRKKYPFDFNLQIGYMLDGEDLFCEAVVINTGPELLPFNIGFHPGFRTAKNCYLCFSGPKRSVGIQRLKNGIRQNAGRLKLDEGALMLTDKLFGEDAVIVPKNISRWVSLEQKNSSITLFRGNFPSLGVWRQPGAPFTCLEPWLGMADGLSDGGEIREKEHIQLLAPGEYDISHFSIHFGLNTV